MSLEGSALYDVFLSYAHVDVARVRRLAIALRDRGLKVCVDEDDFIDFKSISQSISSGVANAKALVAFYSDVYPTRRPCQWELTAHFSLHSTREMRGAGFS